MNVLVIECRRGEQTYTLRVESDSYRFEIPKIREAVDKVFSTELKPKLSKDS